MTEQNSALTDAPGLVALLYRADPDALCLAADISTETKRPALPPDGIRLTDWAEAGGPAHQHVADDGEDEDEPWDGLHRVLLAPGGRSRVEVVGDVGDVPTSRLQFVSDGASQWMVAGQQATQVPSSFPVLDGIWDLLAPSWLLAGFTLTFTGAAEAAGRPAWRAVGEPRPVASVQQASRRLGHQRLDHVKVLIDAELGILLRLDGSAGGKRRQLSEVQSLTLNPERASDPAQFQLPHGVTETDRADGLGSIFDVSGPGWRAVKTVAGVATDGIAFTIRHSSRSAPEAGIPPVPDPGPDSGTAAPVSDELINLLHRTGLPPQRFTATGRKWADGEQLVRSMGRMRAAAGPLSGLLGPEGIWNALASRPPSDTFEEIRLQLALPGRYRVDYLRGGQDKTAAVGSDGEQPWALYPNRVVTGLPRPLPHGWDTVTDPAWLLLPDWQLSADGEEEIGGRRGWRVWASARPGRDTTGTTTASSGEQPSNRMYRQLAAVIDAELGIILRLADLSDGQPAICWELTDVTAAPDTDAFRRPDLPGRRVVEDASLLGYLDIPEPLRTTAKAGLAGVKLLAGLLGQSTGARRDDPRDIWDDASDD